jgi:hypothetical protein
MQLAVISHAREALPQYVLLVIPASFHAAGIVLRQTDSQSDFLLADSAGKSLTTKSSECAPQAVCGAENWMYEQARVSARTSCHHTSRAIALPFICLEGLNRTVRHNTHKCACIRVHTCKWSCVAGQSANPFFTYVQVVFGCCCLHELVLVTWVT